LGDREMRRRETRAHDLRDLQLMTDAERAQRAFQFVDGQPRVDERGQDHVSRGSGETVEVHDARHQKALGVQIDQYRLSASPRWWTRSMPTILPADASRRVSSTSSWVGVGSPDG